MDCACLIYICKVLTERFMASSRSPDMDQAGPSYAPSDPLPGTFLGLALDLQLHHPRFLEFVGAPESARLLDCSPTFWVDQLGKEQVMAAAINLQQDAGIMLSNLQILSQFATSLHRMSFQMMVLGIGQTMFPQAEVADLSPAPRAARAAKYMSAMGLWRPQMGPVIPGQCRLRHAARV